MNLASDRAYAKVDPNGSLYRRADTSQAQAQTCNPVSVEIEDKANKTLDNIQYPRMMMLCTLKVATILCVIIADLDTNIIGMIRNFC